MRGWSPFSKITSLDDCRTSFTRDASFVQRKTVISVFSARKRNDEELNATKELNVILYFEGLTEMIRYARILLWKGGSIFPPQFSSGS